MFASSRRTIEPTPSVEAPRLSLGQLSIGNLLQRPCAILRRPYRVNAPALLATRDELRFGAVTGVLSQTTFGVELKAHSGKATCDGASSSPVWRPCCHSARVR